MNHSREFIKDKLYYTWVTQAPQQTQTIHYFTIDNTLIYINFYSDFGPNSLAHVLRFCEMMKDKFNNPNLKNKKICLYSSSESDKRANAAFLMCTYMLLVQKKKPEEAFQPLVGINPPFLPYRDAGYGAATYHITILDCLKGLYKALNMGLLHIENIDANEYEFYEKVEHGDLNWITDKFIALACPRDDIQTASSPYQSNMFGYNTAMKSQAGAVRKPYQPAYKMDDLVSLLKERGSTMMVRLNNKTYDKKKICEAGIEHVELYFPDGTTPPEGILKRFLDLCESQPGVIAVHCKAGLGRTGTLIACYIMKHYKFTASEVIGLLRVLRPGSVVGPQQNYLQSMQAKLWRMHPATVLSPEISMLRPPTFPTSQRFPNSEAFSSAQIRTSTEQLNAAVSRLQQQKSSSSNTDLMVVDNEDDLEAELGSITMDDVGAYGVEQNLYYQEQESPVTLATAALNMTTMDSEATIEYAEGGGGIYAGYAVPVQPRKQIAATKRDVVGGSVPSAGFAKNYHPASTADQWRNNTPLPNSKTPEPSMGHPHTTSQQSQSSAQKNYAYSSKPTTSSAFTQQQGAQPRYNLRPNSQASSASRPGTQQMQPRSVSRAETSGIEALMVAGKNVERQRVVPTAGMSFEEAQMEQQKQSQKIGGNRRG
ncbi:dual specificity protein phosphatase [Obelidium mucronatum]|nr:dual specificity protein phosphatase [Obelidium mucronatum]